MSGLSGACVGGRILSSMSLFLWTLLDFCCKEGLCVVLAKGSGLLKRKDGEAAASACILSWVSP